MGTGIQSIVLYVYIFRQTKENIFFVVDVFSIIESIQNIHEEQPEQNFLPGLFESDIPLLLEKCKHVLAISFFIFSQLN